MYFSEIFKIRSRNVCQNKRHRPRRAAAAVLAVIMAAMLCSGCGKTEQATASPARTTAAEASAAAPAVTPESSSAPESAVPETAAPAALSAGEQYLLDAQAYLDAGEYYLAFDAVISCQNETDNAEIYARSEELIEQIKTAVAENEPENGEELERTFSVSGGGQLCVSAQSGPLEMLVTDNDNPKQYVRFYVRQGETGNICLPGGRYTVVGKLGYIWFDGETGFGEYYEPLVLEDPLEFDFNMAGGWVSNSVWTLTI